MLQLLRPNSSNLPCLYSTFHLEYPLVLSRFCFLSSNIPSSPAYGVVISQLIRYARVCSSYKCFILRTRRLSSKLIKQEYLFERLKSSFRKFYGRYGDLIRQCGVSLSWMLNDIMTLDPWPVTVTSKPIRLSTNSMTLIQGLTFTELRLFSMEHLQRVWLASRERLPFRTPSSVPLGTCVCSNCWDQFYRTCRIFSRLFTLIPLRTFSILH